MAMQGSRRAKRMARHHKRHKQASGLNLVSLMDIFTILVFFLLVNSSDVEVLPNNKTIELPESIAEAKPKETVVVTLSETDILVQGRSIITVEEAIKGKKDIIEPLKAELAHHLDRIKRAHVGDSPVRGEVTILGDKDVPFKLLKKVMATCSQSQFGDISLAVIKKQVAEAS